eukprot:SAG31_NODE_1454_length_8278_cov_7.030688_2_plen_51_part_00
MACAILSSRMIICSLNLDPGALVDLNLDFTCTAVPVHLYRYRGAYSFKKL